MNEEIKEYIKKYIKGNLEIQVNTSNESEHYGGKYAKINIVISLDGETVSETEDTISL
tara:strand:+ start:305 stop:478 length:174 start_codon:yes stop_codon:yes gene_type:complete